MPHTASSWGSCGRPSDVLCCRRESMEPCSITSPTTLFWQTLKPRDAEISSATLTQKVGLLLLLLQQSCFLWSGPISLIIAKEIAESLKLCEVQPVSVGNQLYFCSPVQPSEPADGNTGYQQLSAPQLCPNIRCFVFPRADISRFKPARWAHEMIFRNVCPHMF